MGGAAAARPPCAGQRTGEARRIMGPAPALGALAVSPLERQARGGGREPKRALAGGGGGGTGSEAPPRRFRVPAGGRVGGRVPAEAEHRVDFGEGCRSC